MTLASRISSCLAATCVLVVAGAWLALTSPALAQNVDCATCVPTPDCPCNGGVTPFGCNTPAGCTDPGGCTGLPGTCLFIPGAPLGAAPNSPEAHEAGRRLQCAVQFALANNVPQIFICGQYSIENAHEFGTDVAAFRKIGAGRVLTMTGRSSNPADAVIRVSPMALNPFRFFFVEDGGSLSLENLTLREGRADFVTNSSGGAVFVESTASGNGSPSRFEATNCAFDNNFARADGGAIRFEDGNRDPNGGLALEDRAFFRLTRCTFTENHALQQGGAVATSDLAVVLGCTFTSNRAGAALPATANGLGGGFWAGPRTGGAGAASAPVFMRSSTAPAIITSFVNNVAGEGGGMFVRGPGTRELESVLFQGNQAQSPISGSGETGGGGLHGESSDLVTIFACTFQGNAATQADAGGVLSELTNMQIVNSVFMENTAANVGGAGRMSGSQRSLYRQCTIQENEAPSGGGVYVDNNADVAFDDCIIRLNTATAPAGAGGGLFLGGGRPFLYNCTLTANSAARGSGIFNNGAGTAIVHCTVAHVVGAPGVKAIQFGPKPSDPVVILNSIVGDEWVAPIADQAFDLPLPPQVTVRYSDVEIADINAFNSGSMASGNFGNINCDPLFANLPGGDVHLTECSPAIDRAREAESDDVFAGVAPPSGQWGALLGSFFDVCGGTLGHCRGDYDDDGTQVFDSNPVITDAPAIPQTRRKTACESDMGADEYVRVLFDSLAVLCDPGATGNGTPPNPDTNACDPLCEGENLCLDSAFDGECVDGLMYQWYVRRNLPGDPAACGQDLATYVPVVDDGRITGSQTPTLCFAPLVLTDSGCYKLVVTRTDCAGPLLFLLGEDVGGAPICVPELEACVCVDVFGAPVVNSDPADAAVCVGGTQAICASVAVPEGCVPVFTWYRKAGVPGDDSDDEPIGPGGGITISFEPIPGIPDKWVSCLIFSPAQPAHAGAYYAYVRCGSDLCRTRTANATLTVIDPQPLVSDAAVCVGGMQCFEQTAVLPMLPPGYSYTYQWFFRGTSDCLASPCPNGDCTDGTPLPGETNPTLCFNNAQLSHAGCYYVVVGLDGPDGDDDPDLGKCMSASNCACLVVVNPQPTVSDAAVCAGGMQCLEQTAVLPQLPMGYSYTFQWFFAGAGNCLTTPCPGGPCTGGTPLNNVAPYSGVMTETLCITGAQPANAGCYYVVVGIDGPDGPGIDAAKCNVASNCACLSVVNPQPAVSNAAVCVGGTQCLEQTAALPSLPAGYTYTYQWFFGGTSDCLTSACPPGACTGGAPLTNSGGYSGVTTPTLCIGDAQLAHRGCYYVQVGIDGPEGPDIDAAKCLVNSNCACLTVVNPQPQVSNAAVCLGGTQTLEQTVTLPALPMGYSYTFQWFFAGTSDCAAAGCGPGPCAGGAPLANGPRPSGTVVAGATTANLVLSNVQLPERGCYYVVVGLDGPEGPDIDAAKCSVASNCACLTVVNPQPMVSDAAVCSGGTQCLEMTNTLPMLPAGYNYTFQWFYSGISDCLTSQCGPGPCTGGTPVANLPPYSGANTPTLCIGNAQTGHRGCYYLVVGVDGPEGPAQDGPKCAAASNCACLVVINPQPTVGGAAVCVGGDQCLSVNVAALPPLPANYTYTFLWHFRGQSDCGGPGCPPGLCTSGTPLFNSPPYSGVDTPTLCVDNAQPAHGGCYYVVVGLDGPEGDGIDAGKCSVASNCACLAVLPQPSVTVHPQPAAVCVGGTQTFTATVAYTGTAQLCWEWRRKPTCGTPGDGVVVAMGTWSPPQSLTFSHTIADAQAGDEACYFLRVRVCSLNEDKCPAVDSECACLDVREPPVACTLPCDSGETDPVTGDCLFCEGVRIVLCCDVPNPEGPLCYQWQRRATPVSAWLDLPGQTGPCFIIPAFSQSQNAGCYRVVINYADLAGPNCPQSSGKCAPVTSDPICIARTSECCPIDCLCKDNSGGVQDTYSLWQTGEWDGVNGELSFDRSTTDGVIVKSADDFFLEEGCMHQITTFTGSMLVRQTNPALALRAKLRFYEDCNGMPGDLIGEFDSECAAFEQSSLDGFSLYQFQFFLDCFWLRGGIYWASLVAIAPSQDNAFEAYWASAGLPGDPPTPVIKGVRPKFMEGMGPWQDFDPCCHPCTDLQFCIIGETCPIIWDNGLPFLAGADAPSPGPGPFQVNGTRSEKSSLPVRDSRAADQFTVKTCMDETVCYLEGYIFTNCVGFDAHLEIYENNCRVPDFLIPGGTPYYQRLADEVIDLGLDGLKVGATNVRAYKVVFCNWPAELTLLAGRNYWASLSVRDSFSSSERAYFAHIRPPCDPCEPVVWKIDPGMEIAPGRGIPAWQSIGEDLAFLIATRKPEGALPAGDGPPPPSCVADADGNGTVEVQDIFAFLSAWFAGCP